MKNYFFLLAIMMAGCSFKKDQIENQTNEGHEELYSAPKYPGGDDEDKEIKRIVIAATNDIQGNYEPQPIYFRDDHNAAKQSITVGGFDVIERYFTILRRKYENIVLVDSGDIFSRGDLSKVKNFYKKLYYDAVTVGLSDFNLKLPQNVSSSAELFKSFANTSPIPLLLSNLYELKTARVVEWTGTKPYILKNVGGVKVGMIGLIPDDVVPQTPINNRVGFYVDNMLQSTLRHARLLRSLGADILIVLTHQGINCGHEIAADKNLPLTKVNFEPQNPKACDLKSIMGEYLRRLPPHLVDVVVGGRHHEKMANFINGTLVISSFPNGKSFSFAELFVNVKAKQILREKTLVHQPVMFCHEFFKETNDCYTEDPTIDHKHRTPAKFLDEIILLPGSPVSNLPTKNKKDDLKVSEALSFLGADIAYMPEISGDSQLMTLKVTGLELSSMMEEDYNLSKYKHWKPSPFIKQQDKIEILISGENINPQKTYTLLSDLEALQQHPIFKKKISLSNSRSLAHFSWKDLPKNSDDVSLRMAAQKH